MRPTATALASTLALAATLVLAVGCADRDTDAPDGDAAPDAAVPPTGGDGLPSADADIPMRFQGRVRGEATYRFRLSDDGDMLTDLEGGMERVRCE